MKINEVERAVGITRRNIRFYEEEGLLTPARNSQNGYREYGDREISLLRQIKLLRKLGVPLEEICRMQKGQGTVADAMRRHLVTLEREQEDVRQHIQLCQRLKEQNVRLEGLDAQQWLEEMEALEQEGTTFQNKQRGDMRVKRYIPSAIVAGLTVAAMAGLIALTVWAFRQDPILLPGVGVMAACIAVPAAVIFGVLLALMQRWREIRRGEEDEARKY